MDLSEFQAILVCIVSSRSARASSFHSIWEAEAGRPMMPYQRLTQMWGSCSQGVLTSVCFSLWISWIPILLLKLTILFSCLTSSTLIKQGSIFNQGINKEVDQSRECPEANHQRPSFTLTSIQISYKVTYRTLLNAELKHRYSDLPHNNPTRSEFNLK